MVPTILNLRPVQIVAVIRVLKNFSQKIREERHKINHSIWSCILRVVMHGKRCSENYSIWSKTFSPVSIVQRLFTHTGQSKKVFISNCFVHNSALFKQYLILIAGASTHLENIMHLSDFIFDYVCLLIANLILKLQGVLIQN